jgi:hypothetical protein
MRRDEMSETETVEARCRRCKVYLAEDEWQCGDCERCESCCECEHDEDDDE